MNKNVVVVDDGGDGQGLVGIDKKSIEFVLLIEPISVVVVGSTSSSR